MSLHTTTEEIVLSYVSNSYKELVKVALTESLILSEKEGQVQTKILSYKH